MNITHTNQIESAEQGDTFACAECGVQRIGVWEGRIGGWTLPRSTQDELADPLLMVYFDIIICRECWMKDSDERLVAGALRRMA
jgi:hypothetical protein